MNLTSFLNKVDQTIEKYGREELLQVIHEIARTLPESKRTDFLNQINLNAGNINRTEKTVIELKKEHEKCSHYLAEIEKGEVYLREVYNEELMLSVPPSLEGGAQAAEKLLQVLKKDNEI